MKMVKFGADQILSGKGGTYTDEDIDALIAKGEEKTSAMQAKLETDAQHNLASFSLLGDESSELDTFAFGGKNYRDKPKSSGNFINLPQRERKRNYDVNEYFRETMNPTGQGNTKSSDNSNKKRKKATYSDFQLFNKERLEYYNSKEAGFASKREDLIASINAFRAKAKSAPSIQNSRVALATGESREETIEMANQMENTLDMFKLSEGKCINRKTTIVTLDCTFLLKICISTS
jgi:SWI/SNF-related matrix-associated actin-dependent regulator of chromatin subfamily A member 5